MDKEYFYSEEKDTLLDGYLEELSSIPDKEKKIAFLGKLPTETRYELLSYLRWETAKAEHKRDDLQGEVESIETRFKEALLLFENGIKGGIKIGEA